MPRSAFSLSTVLVEEYQSQSPPVPFPPELLTIWRQEVAPGLVGLRETDPEEFDCALDVALVQRFYAWLHANGVKRSALCFSGGGIRSATFGLGIVQALARWGLLGHFDYLSTVSGGGYLGSWLSAWVRRERREAMAAGSGAAALGAVQEKLRGLPTSPLDPDPEPVRHLRSYSRYMSPKLGLLSADTWTLVAIFLRNLLLNWLVLLPLLAAGLMFPRFSILLLRVTETAAFQQNRLLYLLLAYWLAVLLGALAISYVSPNRPSLAAVSRLPERFRTQGWYLVFCQLPLTLMAIAITLNWAWFNAGVNAPLQELQLFPGMPGPLGTSVSPRWTFLVFGALLHFGGWLISRFWVRQFRLLELVTVLITGAVGGLLAWTAGNGLFSQAHDAVAAARYVCFATPLLLLLYFLASILFSGLASYFTSDGDREWLARSSAWLLITIVVRAALAALVLFGPVLLVYLVHRFPVMISSLGGASGLLTLILGAGPKSGSGKGAGAGKDAQRSSMVTNLVLALAAPVFVLFLLVLLSLGTTRLVKWVTDVASGHSFAWTSSAVWDSPWRVLDLAYQSPWWAVVMVLAGYLALGWLMGYFINVNRFSLHGAYRDRLIRAYLGASRGPDRKPNPFTGFDDADNMAMQNLAGNRPFHVVNMTLNLVAGKDLAWQDRKASSFTASPLHAGSLRLGYRDAGEYGRRGEGQQGISLGTAMAISGAAASPNMGYHSSPVVTFLLALFNVRLGWWLGNPGKAGDETYDTPGPRYAARSLFAEAFGLTDAEHPFVYLSDGGHFENLGLYEMVLRRCHFIVVSDGGADPHLDFEDLGNAIAKIRVDLGVPILFEKLLMRPRGAQPQAFDRERGTPNGRSYAALARICYSSVDGGAGVEDGLLLYVKPALDGSEPIDVFRYARQSSAFPHESTGDQMYSESQFESYRALGEHAMRTVLSEVPLDSTLAQMFVKVESQLGSPPSGRVETGHVELGTTAGTGTRAAIVAPGLAGAPARAVPPL